MNRRFHVRKLVLKNCRTIIEQMSDSRTIVEGTPTNAADIVARAIDRCILLEVIIMGNENRMKILNEEE